MFSRIHGAIDGGTALFFGAVTVHWLSWDLWTTLSRVSLIFAIILGAGKIVEMFTGRKVSSFFKRKGK